MWSKTMVYSTTSTPDGRTQLSIGDDSITVDVDHTTLDNPELEDRYNDLQSFSENAQSFQILKHKMTFTLFIFLPLLSVVMVPAVLDWMGIAGSGGLLNTILWLSGLAVAAEAFLAACGLAIVRSYYRYRVLSKLDAEMRSINKEIRRRDIDIE